MKIVKSEDMKRIAEGVYPKLKFDEAMAKLKADNMIVPLRIGHGKKHYNVMDKLLTYLA